MKKNIITVIVLALTITFTSCGLTGTTASTTSTTQTTTNAAASGSALGSLVNSSTGNSLLTGLLSTLLSGTTTQQSIVGTWTYSAPEVRFESENFLSQAGGILVANQLKSKMETYLTKAGITAGKSTVTFDASNNFSMTMGKMPIIGTYSYDSSSNTLTLNVALGLGSVSCTCSVIGNTLYLLCNADKMLSILGTATKSSNSTLSSVVNSYNGMKIGMAMTKSN